MKILVFIKRFSSVCRLTMTLSADGSLFRRDYFLMKLPGECQLCARCNGHFKRRALESVK